MPNRLFHLIIGMLLGAVVAAPGIAQERVPEDRQEITLTFAPLVRDAAPAVVNIYARRMVQERRVSPMLSDPFFQRFFGDDLPIGPSRQRLQNALGSGVIVGEQGLVVTNHHVVAGADAITVVLADRREFAADLVLSDEPTDLAVLRLEEGALDGLPMLALGDSDTLEVGDLVLAIGNPFGVGQTVTSGIVSAVARAASGISDYSFFIQTDAAINPGNSGGALIDMRGRLVGINTAIFSRDGGSLGIGFAIPANLVRPIVEAAEDGRPLQRPWLGFQGQEVTSDLAESLGLPAPGGVLVNDIHEGGPAARAGIVAGDVVLAFGGFPVDGLEALRFRAATAGLGTRSAVTVNRSGDMLDLSMELEPAPEIPPRDTTLLEGNHPYAGAIVANLSPALIEEIGHGGPRRRGVIVLDVVPRSPAGRLGLREGDQPMSINGIEVDSVAAMQAVLAEGGSRTWNMRIRRGNQVIVSVIHG